MISFQIYCSPRDVVACWAQQWNCTPELIEEVFGIDPSGAVPIADREATYQRIAAGIRTLKARGFKYAIHCEGCGRMAMEMELRARK